MKQTGLTRRSGEQLREKLSTILFTEIADPRLDLVTITGVEVSTDRSIAHVYFTAESSRYEEVSAALESAKGRIRSLLAHAIDWRVTPELVFRIDRSTDAAQDITRALENVPDTMRVSKDEQGYPIGEDAHDE